MRFMVGASLMALFFSLHASELSDAAAACQAGKFRPLTTNNALSVFKSGTLNEPLFPYSNGGVWEPVSQRMLYIGAAHQVPLRFIGYTETDNNWRIYSMPAGFTGVSHSYDQQTLDSAGMLYYIQWSNGRMYFFNTRTNRWVDSIDGARGSFGTLDYFPEKNGLVRTVNGTTQFFDIGKHQWSTIGGSSMGSMHNLAEYSHSDHCIYFGGGDGSRAFYRIDTNFQVRSLTQFPVDLGVNNGHMTVDPVTGTIIITKQDSFWSYNSSANSWKSLFKNPLSNISSGYTAVIPIPTYGVIAILSASSWPVLLYKHSDPIAVEQPRSIMALTGLSVAPNPGSGFFRINPPSGIHTPFSLKIFNSNGALIRVWSGTSQLAGAVEWNGKDYMGNVTGAGLYPVLLESKGERWSTRIIRSQGNATR